MQVKMRIKIYWYLWRTYSRLRNADNGYNSN